MDVLEKLGDRPAMALIVAGIALGVLVVVRALRGVAGKQDDTSTRIDEMVRTGRYQEAAMLCLRHERLEEAQEYFLRADEPARAAQVAQRLGNHRLAAELFERGGELRKAAACYERIGLLPKAQELLNDAAMRDGQVTGPQTRQRASSSSAVAKYHALKANGANGDAARVELQQAAQRAGEEALANGDIRAAAEIYRDAGLFDEAIHLYANVLGSPGDAAPLLAARGHHDRAAELYELAGMKERAAAAWVEFSRKEGRVEPYIDRVARLEPRTALRMLEEATSGHTPTPDTAELFYRYGEMLERLGDRVRALEVMLTLQRTVAGYRDVDARVRALSAARGNTPVKTSPAPAEASSETHPESSPTVVVQNIHLSNKDLRPEELQALAREAARMASSHARRGSQPEGQGHASEVVTLRLGGEAKDLALLHDAAVQAARQGPSLEALRRYVGDSPCSLKNIEVYYKMGLVCLANGDWGAALRHFQAVEDASPGYRDAAERASQIRSWQQSIVGSVSSGILAGDTQNATRYQIQGELGRGGMAVVYRATDTVLGRDVAMKFIADEALGRREFREMFLREARSIAQLNHPNIVTIYDVGTIDGRAFLAMEFVEGKTIEQLIVEQKCLPVVDALRVTLQVLHALDYAHGRQIIHRDIKPSNMMQTSTGTVKLMDFGLAKSMDAASKTSVIAGTPAYMPPEQFTGQNVDHRADLYAVGVSLYEMLTGELPFSSPVRTHEVPSVRALAPQVPALVDDVLRRVLAIDPSRRYQSARELAAPLQKVLALFEHAMEERDTRRAQALVPSTAPSTPLANAQTLAAHRPPLPKTPVPPPPTAPADPPSASRPKAIDAKPFEERKGTLLMVAAPSKANPPPKSTYVARDAWPSPPVAAPEAPPKRSTMLLEAARPTPARGPVSQATPADMNTGARKATVMLGAEPGAYASRHTSDVPPAP